MVGEDKYRAGEEQRRGEKYVVVKVGGQRQYAGYAHADK